MMSNKENTVQQCQLFYFWAEDDLTIDMPHF